MITRNTSYHIHFFLFSNNDLPKLKQEINKFPEPAESSDIYSETLNYRKEAGLCDDSLGGLSGERVFFFDLDVLITGNLDELFSYPKDDGFYIINDWNTKGDHVGQATCYSFVVGRLGFVKVGFEEKYIQIIDRFGTASQEYLSSCIIDHFGKLNFWPETLFRSFKLHCLPFWPLRKFITPRRPPTGTKVLAFHGHPDLRDAIKGGGHHLVWKKSAKGWKKIYKQCRKNGLD